MGIYSKAFLFEPISKQLNIIVGCNLRFTKSLNILTLNWIGNLT